MFHISCFMFHISYFIFHISYFIFHINDYLCSECDCGEVYNLYDRVKKRAKAVEREREKLIRN